MLIAICYMQGGSAKSVTKIPNRRVVRGMDIKDKEA
jgi:hypothetical protein